MTRIAPVTSSTSGADIPAFDRLREMSAVECLTAMQCGDLTASALLEACIERIEHREPDVRAWSHLAIVEAREQARLADLAYAQGVAVGPLHGLPIGVKDVYDTCDMPSEYGSALHKGRIPVHDADAVALLRKAGAILVGKTTTSEFGMYHPSPTRNPVDLGRSPGVSSAGCAAAVVDRMVPLALGTQHTASTTLPASFCGAHAYKPSFGFSSMAGSNVLVPRLAHLGLFARNIEDLALLARVFDPEMALPEPLSRPPRIGVVHGPGWGTCSVEAKTALADFALRLPTPTATVDLGAIFDNAVQITMGLLNAHLAARFGVLPETEQALLCAPLMEGVAQGRAMTAPAYIELDQQADHLGRHMDQLFDGYDALISLSTPGHATLLEEGPGSGVMSMPWSLCGLPTLSLPYLSAANGLPIGLQVIGRKGCDRQLLQVGAWLAKHQG